MTAPCPRVCRSARLIPAAAACLFLAGCGAWFGSSEEPPLPGKRIPVMLTTVALEKDTRIADLDVRLPRPTVNVEWPQQGGYANHAMHHLALPDTLSVAWRANAGRGTSDEERMLSGPVIADGRVFVIDARAVVSAFAIGDGALLWRTELEPRGERDGSWGAGLAFDSGRLFVTTGFAQVIALDAASGEVNWRSTVSAPMRAAPAARDGRVFAVTKDNQLHALDATSGQLLWSHAGIAETAGLLGGASPAVEGDIVIVPYSSGEIFALRVQNGRELWAESLAAIRRLDAVSALADIRGRPVVDRGRVYAVSHSGRMFAIDLRSGRRIWEAEIGSVEQPWIAGEFIYVLSTDALIACLTARDGRVRWVTPIGLFKDPENKQGRRIWTGPIVAGNRLIIAGGHGEALSLSPFTGEILGSIETPGGVTVPLAVADNTLYLLSDSAELVALR